MSVLHSPLPSLGHPGFYADQQKAILAHLEELLESAAFSGSRRRQAFLRYVVEETLAGRGAAIKERNLAVDVFERNNDFDAQSASIVRVTGSEVRKRLAQAYASGLDRGVRIELPLGSYQPTFHFADTDNVSPASEAAPTEAKQPKRRRILVIGSLVAVVMLAAGFGLARNLVHPPTAADRFWQPFLDRSTPVLISLSSLPAPMVDLKRQSSKSGAISSEDLVSLDLSYVGTGGALGAARFAEQLAFRRQPFQIKFGRDAAFADLKRSPSILIGPSRWFQELTQSLRFRIDRSDSHRAIVDNKVPGREWNVPRPETPSAAVEGYCLVTRWLNSESGHAVLALSGLDPRDTQAGVEFVSNDRNLETFAASLPPDWQRRSFQVVLHNRIHGNSPG